MARKTVANLETTVTARDAGFTAELNRMRNQVDRLSRQTSGLSRTFNRAGLAIVRSLAAPIAGLVSARAAFGAFFGSIERLDNLKDAAAAIDVSATALAGLRYAAKFAGIEAAQLEKALTRLVVRVQEAVSGDKSAVAFFKMLRLDVQELRRLSADQLFLKVSEAIGRLRDSQKITAATVELFGERQARFIALMRQGPAVIRSYMDEFARLSGMNDTMADRAEAAADATLRLKTAWQGFMDALATETPVVPVLDALTEAVGAGGGGGGFGGQPGTAALGTFIGSLFEGRGLEDLRRGALHPAQPFSNFPGRGDRIERLGMLVDEADPEVFEEAFDFMLDIFGVTNEAGDSLRSMVDAAKSRREQREDNERQLVEDLFAPIPRGRPGEARTVNLAPALSTPGEIGQLQAELRVGQFLQSAEQKAQGTRLDILREIRRGFAALRLIMPGTTMASTTTGSDFP